MKIERRSSAFPWLVVLLVAAVAIAIGLWPRPGVPHGALPVAPPLSPGPTETLHGSGGAPESVRGRATVTLLVQTDDGDAISGAEACLSEIGVLAVSSKSGSLTLDLPAMPSAGDIEIRAAGFVPALLTRDRLIDGNIISMRALFATRAAVRVLDAVARGIPGVTVKLVQATEVSRSPVKAETNADGLATLAGLDEGAYVLSVSLGSIDVSEFLGSREPVKVPGPEVTVKLDLPRLAWAKPRQGKVVVGYFRVPVGPGDFGRASSCLRVIEDHCQRLEQGSLASAFLEDVDEVDMVALVDPGGWMTVRVPVVVMTAQIKPTYFANQDLSPLSYGSLVVSARSVGGEPLDGVPFALLMASAGGHGSITFPIDCGVKRLLPVGRYTFVAMQVGAASLFQGPQQVIAIDEGGDASVVLQATRPIKRVALICEQWTRKGNRMDTIDIVRVHDGLGFSTELRPSTDRAVWLPSGQKLTARARCLVGLSYADFEGDFFVSDNGNDQVIVRMDERP